MALGTDKFIIPNGIAVAGKQKMKSGLWGEVAGVMQNANIKLPTAAGNIGQVMTQNASGVVDFQDAVTGVSGVPMLIDTTGTVGPPEDKSIRFNAASQSGATEMYIDKDANVASNTSREQFWLFFLVPGNLLHVFEDANPNALGIYEMIKVTDSGTYFTVQMTRTGTPQANIADNTAINIVVADRRGAGIAAFPRFTNIADTSNQVAPPAPKKIKWNQAGQNTSTEIYISDASYDQRSRNQTMGEFGRVDAILILNNHGDTDNYQLWRITSVVDNAGYWTFGVSLIGSNGANFGSDVMLDTEFILPHTVVSDASLSGSGTTSSPLALNAQSDASVEGIGTGASPLKLNVQSDASLAGKGQVGDTIAINVQSDASLEGTGSATSDLKLNVQHGTSLAGKGQVGDVLEIAVQKDSSLSGAGTAGSPLKLNVQSGTSLS